MTDRGGAGTSGDRVGAFLEALERLAVDDLAVLALPEPDPDARATLLASAEAVAEGAGRLDELQAAPGRAREAVIRAFSIRAYDPTWFGLNWGRSLGRADDRARLLAAVEDAAVAAVVADLLPPDDIAALREPFERVASMVGTAPAASPIIERRRRWRALVAAMFVLMGLTAAWLLVVEFIVSVLGWLDWQHNRPSIDF